MVGGIQGGGGVRNEGGGCRFLLGGWEGSLVFHREMRRVEVGEGGRGGGVGGCG